jgi:hypothetical protein
MGSLVEFKKLHLIATNSSFLLGQFPDADKEYDEDDEDAPPKQLRTVEILPKSLKKIGLNYCNVGDLDQVRELIERMDEVVPELEAITLDYRDTRSGGWDRRQKGEPFIYPGYDESTAQKLNVDCEAAGIKLTIGLAEL